MKTQTSLNLATMFLTLLVLLGAVACGDDSQAYTALLNGEEPYAFDTEQSTEAEAPIDGKADSYENYDAPADEEVFTDDQEHVPANYGAPDLNTTMSTSSFTFQDGAVDIEGGEVLTAFSAGAVNFTSNSGVTAVVLTWDGVFTDVYVRPRYEGGIVGEWEPLVVETSTETSVIGRVTFDMAVRSLDVFVADPASIDFLLVDALGVDTPQG